MAGKVLIMITGANQGLGYYAVQQLAATDKYHILLGSRDFSKAEKAIKTLTDDESVKIDPKNIEPIQIDVSSDESIQKAADVVGKKHGFVDILMVNAGISHAPGTTREHYRQVYDTNVFGAVATVDAFLPLLRKSTVPGGKRIAFTTSGLSSLTKSLEFDGGYHGANFPIYRSSKTALNMVMVHYARLLESEGFVVSASQPGHCSTNLNGYRGAKDPRDGAEVLIRAATEVKDKVHGRVVDENGPEPW